VTGRRSRIGRKWFEIIMYFTELIILLAQWNTTAQTRVHAAESRTARSN